MKNICKTAIYLSLGLMAGIGAQAQQINTQTAGYNSVHMIDTGATILNPSLSRHGQHVYTNEDLAIYAEQRAANAPHVIATTQPATNVQGTTQTAANSQNKQDADGFKKQVDDLKLQISLLQRDIDMDQRELKLRHTYGNYGEMWSSDGNFAVESQKLHDGLQSKQQKLATTQQNLESLKDTARKAGVKID